MSNADRVCIYCGRPANSIEHIFATWLIRDLSAYLGHTLGTGTIQGPAGSQSIYGAWTKKGHRTFEFTTNRVCADCNSSWMNVIDERYKPYFATLIRGNPVAISGKLCKAVSAWAVKTGITARFAHVDPHLVDEAWTRQLRRDRRPSQEWVVWITRYVGDQGFWYKHHNINLEGLTRVYPSPDDAPPTEPPVVENGVAMTLVLAQLCVQVFRLGGRPHNSFIKEEHVSHGLRIWPPAAKTSPSETALARRT